MGERAKYAGLGEDHCLERVFSSHDGSHPEGYRIYFCHRQENAPVAISGACGDIRSGCRHLVFCCQSLSNIRVLFHHHRRRARRGFHRFSNSGIVHPAPKRVAIFAALLISCKNGQTGRPAPLKSLLSGCSACQNACLPPGRACKASPLGPYVRRALPWQGPSYMQFKNCSAQC